MSIWRFAQEDGWDSQPEFSVVPVKEYQLFLDFTGQETTNITV